jgi:hypothetical protein
MRWWWPAGLWADPGCGARHGDRVPRGSLAGEQLLDSVGQRRRHNGVGTTASASRNVPRAARVPTRPAYSGGQVGHASR